MAWVLKTHVKVLVTQSCPTLCDPIACSLLGFSVDGSFQARILEWVAISFSRGSSLSRDWTCVYASKADSLIIWITREAHEFYAVCDSWESFLKVKIFKFPKFIILFIKYLRACYTSDITEGAGHIYDVPCLKQFVVWKEYRHANKIFMALYAPTEICKSAKRYKGESG